MEPDIKRMVSPQYPSLLHKRYAQSQIELASLRRQLAEWKKSAEPYAKTPEGLTVELQTLEELVAHSRSA